MTGGPFTEGQRVIALDGRIGTYRGSYGDGVYAFVAVPGMTMQLIPMADLAEHPDTPKGRP
jgi:hypothetical protein